MADIKEVEGGISEERKKYLRKRVGRHPDLMTIIRTFFERDEDGAVIMKDGRPKSETQVDNLVKKEDLRYGENPGQTTALLVKEGEDGLIGIGSIEALKSGKQGKSETNLRDVNAALGILKYFEPVTDLEGEVVDNAGLACIILKHNNPAGAMFNPEEDDGDENLTQEELFKRALETDPLSAFGGYIGFNSTVTYETALAIMSSGLFDGVVAPGYTPEALERFNTPWEAGGKKINASIRIDKVNGINKLARFVGDDNADSKLISMEDGSILDADPFLTNIRSVDDLRPYVVEDCRQPTEGELTDALTGFYMNTHVKSNGVLVFKNGQLLACGTGEQNRVGAIQQAIAKVTGWSTPQLGEIKANYQGHQSIDGAVLISDAFVPDNDCMEAAYKAGIKVIALPFGSRNDENVKAFAKEHDMTVIGLPAEERHFYH